MAISEKYVFLCYDVSGGILQSKRSQRLHQRQPVRLQPGVPPEGDRVPGGGYIFDFDGSLENANPENLDAMFETLNQYGKY